MANKRPKPEKIVTTLRQVEVSRTHLSAQCAIVWLRGRLPRTLERLDPTQGNQNSNTAVVSDTKSATS